MSKKTILPLVVTAILIAVAAFLKWGPWQGGVPTEGWFPGLVVFAALIDSINPCAFSILLITIGFLVSLGTNRRNILGIGGAYIAGIFGVYVLIGLGILNALHLFNTPHFMAKIGASILLAVGAIDILGYLYPNFPIKLQLPKGIHGSIAKLMNRGSLPGAFLLGGLVGACEFPCTGGPYLMILGMLHDQGRYLSGLGYLGLYNLVFILPLVAILVAASNPGLLERVQDWKRTRTGQMRLVAGSLMVGLGLVMFLL